MNTFLWNLFLSLLWATAAGKFTVANLIIGFVLGYVVLWLVRGVLGPIDYFLTTRRAFALFFYFLWELFLANLQVAYQVVSPTYHMRPGVVAIPLDAQTDLEISLLASLITLTPGTLSLDVSEDRRVLYIHAMFIDSPDEIRRQVKQGFERRIVELLR